MSRPTKRTAKRTATIWPKKDEGGVKGYGGGVTYGDPYLIKVCFMQGGSREYSDTKGVLFTPNTSYWYELPEQGKPKINDMIAIGDHLAFDTPQDVEGAELMRLVQLQDCSLLNDIDDVMVLT